MLQTLRTKTLPLIVSTLSLGAVALGAAGCGKSLPKLTDAQKAEVGDTLQAAGRAPRAANVVGAKNPAASALVGKLPASSRWFTGMLVAADATTPGSISEDDTTLAMETQMRNSSEKCQFVANVPNMPSQSMSLDDISKFSLTLKVSGDSCPLSMDFGVSMQGSESSGVTGKLSGQFAVKDAEFAKLNDVNAINFDGSFSANGNESGAKIKFDAQGTLTSKKNGQVSFSGSADVSADRNGSDGEIVMDIKFTDFEAEFKQKSDGKSVTYSINGDTVTESEFMAYFNKLGAGSAGVAQPRNNNLPTPSTTASPSYPYPSTTPTPPAGYPFPGSDF